MKRALAIFAAALLAIAAMPVGAAGGAGVRFEPAPLNRLDVESLQRGARTFVNYCLNCHSARYMRYNRLVDLGIDEGMIHDNLMFATDKIGETMTAAMTTQQAKAWFGTVPPDLTVIARVRGAEWLYNYFLGFYRDDRSATGWNNLVFPNVGMPHVLWRLSGTNRLVTNEFEDYEKAQAAQFAARGLAVLAPARDHKFVVETLAVDTPGTLTLPQYMSMVADLVNFLDYMAEPNKNYRITTGLAVLAYLIVLFVVAYLLKRVYWKDLH